MITLIRWLLKRYRPKEPVRTPTQKVGDVLAGLRQASETELGGALAVAVQAKKTLDTTKIIATPFPADILDGAIALDDAARVRLLAYAAELERFRGMCLAQGTILTISVARGLDTWIATCLALALPAIAEGREIWVLLKRGEGNVESAYRFMVRRDLTDVERGYLDYRPRVLVEG